MCEKNERSNRIHFAACYTTLPWYLDTYITFNKYSYTKIYRFTWGVNVLINIVILTVFVIKYCCLDKCQYVDVKLSIEMCIHTDHLYIMMFIDIPVNTGTYAKRFRGMNITVEIIYNTRLIFIHNAALLYGPCDCKHINMNLYHSSTDLKVLVG